jgi:phosphoribosylpyrophosphate synthetase
LNALDEIEEIVITDTVPLPEERQPARLTVLSVADIFGAVIRRNVLGGSIGDLFAFWRASSGQDYESESP